MYLKKKISFFSKQTNITDKEMSLGKNNKHRVE